MTDPMTPTPPELDPPGGDPDVQPVDVPQEVPQPDMPGGGENDPRPYDVGSAAR